MVGASGYGTLAPVTITASILVTQTFYFGNLPIEKISGFKDELSGQVTTNAFKTGIFSPEDVLENWVEIASEDELPVKPMMTLVGLLGWRA